MPRSARERRELGRRLAVPRQRQDARAGLQMADDAFEGAAVQADQRHVLQRPAEPRRRQAEGRGVGQAKRLVGREWSAAAGRRRRSGRDRRSPARRPAGRDASRSPAGRRRSGSARRACGRGSALRPARDGACRRPPARPPRPASRHRRQPFDAVLADADDGQPARGRAACGCQSCAFSSSAARRKPRRWPSFSRAIRASRRPCRFAGRTAAPRPQPIATRIGGFGGADGLARLPRASRRSRPWSMPRIPLPRASPPTPSRPARAPGVALASLVRPAWKPEAGDNWQTAPTAVAAAAGHRQGAARVFLTLGRQELHSFARHRPAPLRRPPHRSAGRARGRHNLACCSSADRSIAKPNCAC